jgi:predicted hotdog family 3-hydroxylacyl-ACP dehydratase
VLLDKDAIAKLIPHAGRMCLLDGVLDWSQSFIRCSATNHRNADNPLRHGNRLPVFRGIEYAAQAMAVHGGLTGVAGQRPRVGYLASLRNVTCKIGRLDVLAGPLIVVAESLMSDDMRVIYRFDMQHEGQSILAGQAAVVLDAGAI